MRVRAVCLTHIPGEQFVDPAESGIIRSRRANYASIKLDGGVDPDIFPAALEFMRRSRMFKRKVKFTL